VNNKLVTDTMALILRLEKRKLSPKVRSVFEDAEKGESAIIIPAMVLAELGYLSEKGRIETNLKEVREYCSKHSTIIIEPITEEVIEKTFEIDDIPELHDRIIAGTALKNNLKLITNDPVITKSKFITVIW